MSNPYARDFVIRRDLAREDRTKWRFLIKQLGQDVPRWVSLDDLLPPTDTLSQPDAILQRKEQQVRDFVKKAHADKDLWKHLSADGKWSLVVADTALIAPGQRVETVGADMPDMDGTEWEFLVKYENNHQARWMTVSSLLASDKEFNEDQEDLIVKISTFLDDKYDGQKKLVQNMPQQGIDGGSWTVVDFSFY